MKRLFFLGIFLFLFTTVSSAETNYIINDIKVNIRTGAGTSYNIIAMINAGVSVELIERGDEWSQIRLQNEREGWILTRFLTSQKPDYILLEGLRKTHKILATKFPKVADENKKIKKKNNELNKKLVIYQKKNKKLQKTYDILKKEAAGFIELKGNYEKTALKLSEQTEKNEKLNKELMHKYITAGLCGAGILLLGFIIGFSTKSQRRRSSLL